MFAPSGNLDKWYIDMCEYSKKKKETCDYCNTESKLPQYYIQTPSYYRNKSSGHYFFCSSECRDKFENEKICKHCHYQDRELKKPEGTTFMLCTSHPGGYRESCYIKHIGEKCSFCWKETDIDKLNLRYSVDDKLNYYSCDDCFSIYKNIVLKDNDDFAQPSDNDCIFCYTDTNDCVNSYYLCEDCLKVYKIFVFGKKI